MRKNLLFSSILFLFVFCVLGLPFTHWWFNGDDFSGIAIAFHTKTWRELFHWFIDGNIARYFYPSHAPDYAPPGAILTNTPHCFGFYYRPLYCVYLTLIHWVFGLWAYPFYLANVFFHALNTVIVFNCALWFVNFLPALLTALLFAFHPQIGFRFGSIVNLHYYIDLFLILSSLLLFKKFLDTRKIFFYLFSCLLFLGALFTRETAIVLPIIIFLGSYVYQNKNAPYSWHTFFNQFFVHFTYSFGYGLCALFYLGTRLWLYPINFQASHTNLLSIVIHSITNLRLRCYEFVTFLYDMCALSWLPWGHKILRGSILAVCLLFFIYLFLKNKNKLITLFFACSSVLMLWPMFMVNYSPRYFYEAYPFILLTLVTCFSGIKLSQYFKTIVLVLFTLFVSMNIVFTYQNVRCRENKLHITHTAITNLVNKIDTKNPKPLVFLSFPIDGFGTGIEQAVWVMYGKENFPIYYDPCLGLVQADSNLITNKFLHAGCADYFNKNYVSISRVNNTSFRYITSDPDKMFFYVQNQEFLSIGKKVINHTDQLGRILDFTLLIDQKYLEPEPIFLYWDYEKRLFKSLPSHPSTRS